MGQDLMLAVDCGTQSVRALIFDLEGHLQAKAQVPLEAYVSPQPGWAEQDPDYYWTQLCAATRQVLTPELRARLAGMALTTQRATVVNVGRDGRPLRPAIVWLDQRRTEGLPPLKGLWGLIFALIGMGETVAYLQSEAEANWIRTQQPDVWARTYKYLLLSGYLTYRLTGRFVDSVGCQVGYIPFDYKRQHWSARWDWKWQAVPMRPDMLPELVPVGGRLGEVSREAAEATGLPEGLPIIAAAADKACEVLGAGCLSPYTACLSYGTTATINTTQTRYVEAIPLIPPYPAAVPNAYNLEIQIYRGFWMVEWFKHQFGYQEVRLASELGIQPEQLFDEMISRVPAGSMGLVLQPYWSPGLREPGPEAKGAIIGFGDVHTRAHVYRAILEGLAYALREGKERCEKRTHTPITELRVAGGGSQSNVALQITADVFGMPVSRPHVYEASALGAAIDAAVGLGLHADFREAVAAMTRVGERFEPNPATHALYDALYKRVYRQLYPHLKRFYAEIRDITGYPPRYRAWRRG